MGSKEIIRSYILLRQFRTNGRVSQTRPYPPPVIRASNMISQPGGETLQPVLLVSPAGHMVRAVRARDDEGKDQYNEE